MGTTNDKQLTKRAKQSVVKAQCELGIGSLTHNGTAWSTTITSDFSGKGKKLIIEFEGMSKDKVTDVQRKAFAEYTKKEQ